MATPPNKNDTTDDRVKCPHPGCPRRYSTGGGLARHARKMHQEGPPAAAIEASVDDGSSEVVVQNGKRSRGTRPKIAEVVEVPAIDKDTGEPTLTKITRGEYIIRLIRMGNFASIACAAAGVSSGTFYEWMRRGVEDVVRADGEVRTQEKVYAEFAEAVTRARAEAEMYAVGCVRKQMPDDWKAASWYLERTQPDRYAKASKIALAHVPNVMHDAPRTEGGAQETETETPRLLLPPPQDEDLAEIVDLYPNFLAAAGGDDVE